MGRVSNSWRRWSLPQRVSGWQPDGRQATSNPPNRAAAGNPSKQDLFPCRLMPVLSATLSPSKADRYTLRSCSVEDGYSSVQQPGAGVPRQISPLRSHCFVRLTDCCTHLTVPISLCPSHCAHHQAPIIPTRPPIMGHLNVRE